MFQKLLTKHFGFSNNNLSPILKATLLLFISIAGNFLAQTLGCKTQFYLENMYVKHIFILFMIYFTIDFTQGEEIVNPIVNIKKAIIIWVIFHLFTHLDIIPTVIVLLIFMALFFISNYMNYLKKIGKSGSKLNKILKKTESILYFLVMSVILIGFFYYYLEKKNEYGNKFNILQFIFGVKKCKSMK